MHTRPVWAEVSLGRLKRNFRRLRLSAPEAELLAVIKADAYGHGVGLCGPALTGAGAHWLGVTHVEEGVALRAVLPNASPGYRILIMSGLWRGEAAACIRHRLTPQVWEPYHFELLRGAAGSEPVAVHLEVDTGMSRQGVPVEELGELLDEQARSPIEIEGLLTHFSGPEMLRAPDTSTQIARFAEALEIVKSRGRKLRYIHAGNSANVLSHRETAQLAALAERHGARLMMRPGLALYGCPVRFHPLQTDASLLEPVLSWRSRIVSLRTIAAGTGAGYNSAFVAERPTRLALVPAGYADGLNRLLSNRGSMLVGGHRAPIAGRVSMDQTILDVTDVPAVTIGDEVVILGEQGSQRITAYDHADLCRTIPYEILCNISGRVPRIAVD